MTAVDVSSIVLGLTMAIALFAPRLPIPAPVVFAAVGIAVGAAWHLLPALPAIHMPPDVVLFVFLPPLLTTAAYALPLQAFRRNLLPISLLAVGLVLTTTAIVAAIAHAYAGLGWVAAVVLGAILSRSPSRRCGLLMHRSRWCGRWRWTRFSRPESSSAQPIELDPLTVADDANFLAQIAEQPNLPQVVRTGMAKLYYSALDAPVSAQNLQQPRREHHVAVLAALALVDTQHHAGAVDVGGPQRNGFRDAQTAGIDGDEDGAVLGAGHAGQEVNDLRGAEHDGQLQRPFGHRDVVVVPGSTQRYLVEEAQCCGDHAQAAGGELALLEQMDLVGPDLLGAERLGRAVEVPGEGADLLDVGQLGVDGEIANAHVLEHPLAKRCHGGAPVQWNEGR